MEFKLANVGLLQGLKPGDAVSFEFVERSPGEWVVTQIKPAGGMPPGMVMPAEPATNAHSGH
jgi:Cu(I)/Ag(I) efflux system membrane fusion protein